MTLHTLSLALAHRCLDPTPVRYDGRLLGGRDHQLDTMQRRATHSLSRSRSPVFGSHACTMDVSSAGVTTSWIPCSAVLLPAASSPTRGELSPARAHE
jgi:hypothetical protein